MVTRSESSTLSSIKSLLRTFKVFTSERVSE